MVGGMTSSYSLKYSNYEEIRECLLFPSLSLATVWSCLDYKEPNLRCKWYHGNKPHIDLQITQVKSLLANC